MGYYINPPNSTKEAWLAVNGTPISADDAKQFKSEGSEFRVVCLVNNGDFTAAGIAYDDRERDAFAHPDPRPKKWFLVSLENLKPFWSPG